MPKCVGRWVGNHPVTDPKIHSRLGKAQHALHTETFLFAQCLIHPVTACSLDYYYWSSHSCQSAELPMPV
jgi:hypothetical protein